ncbi:MAG: archaetidylserine synthase [Haloarculaceae archaeon]|jgi:archaetidylserine synthase
MSFRVRDRLGLADVVTLANATVGVVAMSVAITLGPRMAARLILLAAVADGLDGIIARTYGGSSVGPFLDAMADVVSFGTASAVFLYVATNDAIDAAMPAGVPVADLVAVLAATAVPAIVVVFSLVRTAFYTVHVGEDERRPGIQNTLAASILAAGYLAGFTSVPVLLGGGIVLSVLMVAPIPYPKLSARDALVMGTVQMAAILAPTIFRRVFPRVLLVAALAYMTLAPRFYWAE